MILKPIKLKTVMQRKVNCQVEAIIQEKSKLPSLNDYAKGSELSTHLKKSIVQNLNDYIKKSDYSKNGELPSLRNHAKANNVSDHFKKSELSSVQNTLKTLNRIKIKKINGVISFFTGKHLLMVMMDVITS